MATQIGFSALLGILTAGLLSIIQIGELNYWSMAFGYSIGLSLPIMSSITANLGAQTTERM